MAKSKYVPSIIQTGPAKCYVCGRQGCELQIHHAIPGRGNRGICTEWGLTVWICPRCHERLHDESVEYKRIKADAQKAFIKDRMKQGYPEEACKEMWYERFLKFYDYD